MNSLNSLSVIGVRSFLEKLCPFSNVYIKMENNYETLRMPELKPFTRELRLRGYSRLRKAELIGFLNNNEHWVQRPPQRST